MLPVSPIITASTIEFQRAQKANDTPHLDWIAENYNTITDHPEAIPARILPLEVVEDLGENKWWEEYPLHSSSSELPGVVGSAEGSRLAAARVPKPRASEKVARPTPRLKVSAQAEGSRKRSAELVEDLEDEGVGLVLVIPHPPSTSHEDYYYCYYYSEADPCP